ncbi:MAG: PepSY domain-containing protein [Rhizobiaceae bacterium]|nr:PepSY domain-containing protein [Rhizobiaceae bacterium]
MKSVLIGAAVLGVLAVAPVMAAGMPVCSADPSVIRMSPEQVKARARMMGFKVVSVEPDQGCWRVEATDDRGRRTVLRIHAGSGEVMARIDPAAIDRRATAATD